MGCFRLLIIILWLQTPCTHARISLGCIPGGESLADGGYSFNFQDVSILFPKTIALVFTSHNRFPIAPHPHHHLLSSGFLIFANLVSIVWLLIVLLIYILLIINDVDCFVICVSFFHISPLVTFLFMSFVLSLLGYCLFLNKLVRLISVFWILILG